MIAILAALAAQAAAPASPVPVPMERFDEVRPGTAAERALELFPEGPGVRHTEEGVVIDDVAVGDCEADGEIKIAGGRVEAIELRGDPALLGRCGARVLEALVARYGMPDKEGGRGETPWRRSRRTYQWDREGLAVRYVHYTSAGYAGSGLLSASWVLSVSSRGPSSRD